MEIITPKDYTGTLIELSQSRRGEFQDMKYLTESRTTLVYDMPLAEVVTDFFDQLKSLSAGYASMEYSITGVYPPLTNPPSLAPLLPFPGAPRVGYPVGALFIGTVPHVRHLL